MPIPWDGDGSLADQFVIEQNLRRLLTEIQHRAPFRDQPSVEMARAWHRIIFAGVPVPVPYYPGGIRDSDSGEPELVNHEVKVGGPVAAVYGVRAADVWRELRRFEASLRQEVARIDQLSPGRPAPLLANLDDVLALTATTHGEWLRIHPFVNGNGRTARVWANWCVLRYGLPAFVRLRPRPAGNTYVSASERSMHGDHRYMQAELERRLRDYLIFGSTS